MSTAVCFLLSAGTAGLGALALYIGLRGDNVAAKLGGSVVIVIGVLGAIACVATD